MLTPKKRAFALAYHQLGDAAAAYRQCYKAENMQASTVRKRASELLTDGDITGMLRELQAEARVAHKLTVDDLLQELEAARQAALNNPVPQCSAAIAATMGKARLLGLDKQIIEQTTTSYVVAPSEAESLDAWSKAA